MIRKSLLIVTILLLNGCIMQNNVPTKIEEPKWLIDPYFENDKIASIGCSKIHFKGKEAQKDLAISRAIDRIATQNNVTVDNITLRKRSINGENHSSSSNSSSLHTISKVTISTKVKDVYEKNNGDICVWVIQR